MKNSKKFTISVIVSFIVVTGMGLITDHDLLLSLEAGVIFGLIIGFGIFGAIKK